MVCESSLNAAYENPLSLFERVVNDSDKQFTSIINLENTVKADAELILSSEITILTKPVDKRL